MNETASIPPVEQFAEVQEQEYANGSHHWYGVDFEGKRTHLRGSVAMQYAAELGLPGSEEGANWINDDPTPELSEERKLEIQKARAGTRAGSMGKLDTLRNEYLKHVVGRSRRGIHVDGGYRKRGVAQALEEYNRQFDEIVAAERGVLQDDLELDPESIDQVMAVFSFGEQRKLARTLHDLRLEATGNYKITKRIHEVDNVHVAVLTELEQVKKGPVGRAMNKFYDWFGSVDESSKLFSKKRLYKGGVMVGVGAAVGVGGGLLLNRIGKAYMSTHIHRKSQDANDLHATKRLNELYSGLGDGTNGVEMTGLITEQTAREVTFNRRRLALGVGTLALGAVGGELIHHLASNGDSSEIGITNAKLPILKPEAGPHN